MRIDFIKCHGSGNDFILVDGIGRNGELTDSNFAQFARVACDRRGSVGADGILFLLPSQQADVRMRIFNADGSEAEMCGNGIRCLARLASELLGKDEISVETAKAVLQCRREEEIYPGVESFSVLIDNVSFTTPDISFAANGRFADRPLPELSPLYRFSAISLGNPHIVAYAESIPGDEEVKVIGEKANADKALFPNGVNVTFYGNPAPQTLYAVTYERGVGLTSACGTAMSASSIAACETGLCKLGQWIDVRNKGGMVRCLVERTADSEGIAVTTVRLLGNATFEYEASVKYDGIKTVMLPGKKEHFTETGAYSAFAKSISESK